MCKHLSLNGISDSVDAWHTCLPVIIDDNLSTVIHSNSSVLEGKSAGEGVSANAYKYDIYIKLRLSFVLSVLQVQLDALLSIVDTRSGSSIEHEFNPLLFQ